MTPSPTTSPARRAPFTDLFLRKLRNPAQGRAEFYDGRIPGFGVRIAASGTKTFFVVGRYGRSFRRVSLGRYPTLTLEKARRKALDALRNLAEGIDPQDARRRHASAPQADTFASVMAEFIDGHCKRNNRPSNAREAERLLKAVFLPEWGTRRIADISKADVARVVDGISAAGKPSAARHAFAAIANSSTGVSNAASSSRALA